MSGDGHVARRTLSLFECLGRERREIRPVIEVAQRSARHRVADQFLDLMRQGFRHLFENADLVSQLFLCLSRACLGKKMIFAVKWRKKGAFSPPQGARPDTG